MKHALLLMFLLVSLSLNACTPSNGAPAVEVGEELVVPTSPPRAVSGGAATATAVPPSLTSSPADATPTSPADPVFHTLRFTTNPSGTGDQTVFPPGTEEIFAVWEYAGLEAEDEMERLWYFNSEPWLERQESWDAAQYGSRGTHHDVSIYDFEGGGLILGEYTLVLRLNGAEQVRASFTVGEGVTHTTSSETYQVEVVSGTQLWVRPLDGERRLVAEGLEIVDITWLSDGNHFLYVERDSRNQIEGTTIGFKHALWLVEASSGTVTQLSSFEEDLHSPVPAPDMRTIALINGTNYFDACGVDRELVFMTLDAALERSGLLALDAFADAPVSDTYLTYPDFPSADRAEHLVWTASTLFQADIRATCIDLENAPEADRLLTGQYAFDLETLAATRLADLPLR